MPIGGVALTSGGKLDCKYVIHTVGPVYHDHTEEIAHQLLKSCINSSLDKAQSLGDVKSISIPAVSSGFPREKLAEIILSTAVEWMRNN